jgi:hypothetical protein
LAYEKARVAAKASVEAQGVLARVAAETREAAVQEQALVAALES